MAANKVVPVVDFFPTLVSKCDWFLATKAHICKGFNSETGPVTNTM